MNRTVRIIDNPQPLVSFVDTHNIICANVNNAPIDAIFIPSNNRYSNINELLKELIWFEGTIYLMLSNHFQEKAISFSTCQNIEFLDYAEGDFLDYYKSLDTYSINRDNSRIKEWDLPIKRSFAIQYSRNRNFQKILLIDDDMRGLTKEVICKGSQCLEEYTIAGCFVEEYPDTSIIGHLMILAGKDIRLFLSGSFLFIRPNYIKDFFPLIYNEDWLFMINYIIQRDICSFGTIAQKRYNPFENLMDVSFQEFGEMVAEGLYALINVDRFEERHDLIIWKNLIDQRRNCIVSLKKELAKVKFQEVLDYALEENLKISAYDCLMFLEKWENDQLKWNKIS